MTTEDKITVLNDIVQRGDEDVIKAARLEREIMAELNRMSPRKPAPSTTGARSDTASHTTTDGDTLEEAIDRIMQRHSEAMRREVQQLLKERLG